MSRRPLPELSSSEGWALMTLFNIADEIDGGLGLDDLDERAIAEAQGAATAHGISWPPYLPELEEFFLDHGKQIEAALR